MNLAELELLTTLDAYEDAERTGDAAWAYLRDMVKRAANSAWQEQVRADHPAFFVATI